MGRDRRVARGALAVLRRGRRTGGARRRAETQRAVDAAARAMAEPLPAHARAEILDRTADLVAERQEEIARTICDEAGKPIKTARVEAERAVSTFRAAAAEARTLAGDVVPMDASPAGVGKVAYTARVPIGVVGAISPFNFPFNLVAHKVAPGARGGLRRRAEAREPDAALGAPARRARGRGGPAAGLAQRARRPRLGDRRRARRGRARAPHQLHRLGRGGLEAPRARRAQEGPARARERDAGDRRGGRRRRGRRGEGRRERLLLRRPELHLHPARLRGARRLRRVPRGLPPEGGGAPRRRPRRRRDRRRPRDRRGREGADPRVDRGGEGAGRHRARRRRDEPRTA